MREERLTPACVTVQSVFLPKPVVSPGEKFKVKIGLKVSCFLQFFYVYFYIDGELADKAWGFHIFPGVYEHEWELKAPTKEGEHILRVITDQEIAEGLPGKTVEFYVGTIPPGHGLLQVVSDPSYAEVYVDGELIGTTPLIVKLKAGIYRLKVSKKGYKPWTGTVTIEEYKVTRVRVKLEKVVEVPWKLALASGIAGVAAGAIAAFIKRRRR